MNARSYSRRKLLGSSVLAVGAAFLGLRPADAFMMLPGEDYPFLGDSACGGSGIHQRLLAQLESDYRKTMQEPELRQRLQTAASPYCGCALLLPSKGEAPRT